MPLDLLRYLAHLNLTFCYAATKVQNILGQQRLLDIFVDRKIKKKALGKLTIKKYPNLLSRGNYLSQIKSIIYV